jgi:hypothetical protein
VIAARQALDGPESAEHLRRTRPPIERLLGLIAARKRQLYPCRQGPLTGLWTAPWLT